MPSVLFWLAAFTVFSFFFPLGSSDVASDVAHEEVVASSCRKKKSGTGSGSRKRNASQCGKKPRSRKNGGTASAPEQKQPVRRIRRSNPAEPSGIDAGRPTAMPARTSTPVRRIPPADAASPPASAQPMPAATRGEMIRARVVRVIDGDTITVQRKNGRKGQYEKIRILGIDAPERSQAWGPEAGRKLAVMIHSQEVRLEVANTDRYGRTVAKVWIGDTDVGLAMIRAGLAWHYRQYYNDAEYAEAEKYARARRLGLWHDEKPLEPRFYRRGGGK